MSEKPVESGNGLPQGHFEGGNKLRFLLTAQRSI